MIRLQIGLAEIMNELVISRIRENVKHNETDTIIIRLVEKKRKAQLGGGGERNPPRHLIKTSLWLPSVLESCL